jgi:hypothetical protein
MEAEITEDMNDEFARNNFTCIVHPIDTHTHTHTHILVGMVRVIRIGGKDSKFRGGMHRQHSDFISLLLCFSK